MSDKEIASPLTSSAPLELDDRLRLHPQQIHIGKAELLTDALTLPFNDIEGRLTRYISGSSPGESEQLRKSIKHYLGRLNANPLIPLSFRMKVLSRFEQDLNLFDGEMTAAVLNAHKIAVEMVQKAAQSNNAYYPMLVDMVSSAISLALKLLLISLEKYHAPAVIATRQFFELAKLGLSVAEVLDDQQKVERLHATICKFELLRLLDFYSKTVNEQHLIWKEVQYHIGSLQAHLCRQGQTQKPINAQRFLVTNLNRPNDAAKITDRLPDSLEYDCILIPVDTLFSRVSTAIEHIQTILSSQGQQHDLVTEEAMITTLVGGKAILKALHHSKRKDTRLACSQGQLCVEWNASRALNVFGAGIKENREAANSSLEQQQSWQILDISRNGVCIEKLQMQTPSDFVGKLIGLCFQDQDDPHANITWSEKLGHRDFKLGFVRWSRIAKAGEQRLGIEFLQGRLQLLKGMILAGNENMDLNRSWPVLITAAGGDSHSAIFPDHRIYRNMIFALINNNRKVHYKVSRVIVKGPNYSLCEIKRAKVKGSAET